MGSDDDIIIRGYKNRVNYYGWFTVPAWAFIAAPIVAFLIGLLVG